MLEHSGHIWRFLNNLRSFDWHKTWCRKKKFQRFQSAEFLQVIANPRKTQLVTVFCSCLNQHNTLLNYLFYIQKLLFCGIKKYTTVLVFFALFKQGGRRVSQKYFICTAIRLKTKEKFGHLFGSRLNDANKHM